MAQTGLLIVGLPETLRLAVGVEEQASKKGKRGSETPRLRLPSAGHALPHRTIRYLASAATCILTILSGAVTRPLAAELPFLILSATSIPETTSPKIVYWPVSGPQPS